MIDSTGKAWMDLEVMGIYYADTEQRVGEATACPQASVGAWMGQNL